MRGRFPGPTDTGGFESDVTRLLELVRLHLDMDVAFLGQFEDADRTMRTVSAGDPTVAASLVGLRQPRDETVCQLVVDGSLPPVSRDLGQVVRLSDIDPQRRLRIGAHVGVPVTLADGEPWGTVCAWSGAARDDLDDGVVATLRLVAALVADRLQSASSDEARRDAASARVDRLIVDGWPAMLGQPIVDLTTGDLVGVEALARFGTESPDEVFELAAVGQRSVDLELEALTRALATIENLPTSAWLSCNVSIRTATDPRFLAVLDDVDGDRLVVEITEHERDDESELVTEAMAALRRRGVGIAMDDVGAAWSGLTRAVALEPEILKLDRELISGIHDDPTRRALVQAVVAFADAVGATLVAEGVELDAERQVLRDVGVRLGQGWLFGHPAPLGSLAAATAW